MVDWREVRNGMLISAHGLRNDTNCIVHLFRVCQHSVKSIVRGILVTRTRLFHAHRIFSGHQVASPHVAPSQKSLRVLQRICASTVSSSMRAILWFCQDAAGRSEATPDSRRHHSVYVRS